MKGLFIALLIIGWLVAFLWGGYRLIEAEGRREVWKWVAIVCAWIVVPLGLLIQASIDEEASGPCLRQETGYAYNAATKTTMPYTRCVERGRWADQ